MDLWFALNLFILQANKQISVNVKIWNLIQNVLRNQVEYKIID